MCIRDSIYTLLKNGLYDVYLVLLDSQDIKTVLIVLESLLYILNAGKHAYRTEDGENAFLIAAEKMGIITKVDKLQHHPHREVYRKGLMILETFYDMEPLI
eukprot:TRINITY_DN895_c0_g1_i5.p1 TRINITY_DN895_c0_g1~~TRINITY_DN895_c0_g1_i5.p1  ORF type:complete len:101 (-),score=28.74 TRINITY_DN895_c0_g1_i5:143-445(-)